MPAASGSSRTRVAGRERRVLPLALAGLAALGHRGAFGADGASSDGAGISLPLDRSVRELIAGPQLAADRPAVAMLFLPARGRCRARGTRPRRRDVRRGRDARRCLARRARRRIARSGRPPRPRVRSSPRPSSPARPAAPPTHDRSATTPSSGGWSIARRRLETAARAAGGALAAGLSVPSVSARTIVYKGLVAGPPAGRLLPGPAGAAHRGRTRCSTSATRPTPARPGRSPSRSARSPTTARSTRSAAIASRSAAGPATGARERSPASCSEAGPLLSPDGSDSLSLDEGLELLTTTGWDLAPALLAAIPEALALRRAPHPHVATLRRRTAGHARAVGWAGRHRLRRRQARRRADRPQRPAAGVLRGEPRPARRRRLRGRRRAPARRPRRSGAAASVRARCCWSSPAVGRSSRTPTPRPGCCASCRSTTPRVRSTRTTARSRQRRSRRSRARPRRSLPRRARRGARPARHQDDGARGARAAVEHGRRHADRRSRPARPTGRRPPAPGVRAGHQPGHRPGARADRHGPAGGARAAAGAARRLRRAGHGPFVWSARSWPTSPGCAWRWPRTGAGSGPSMRRGRRSAGADGLAVALDAPRRGRRRGRPRPGIEVLVVSDAGAVARPAAGAVDPRRRRRPHGPDRMPVCAAGRTSWSMPPTSSTSTRWRWSSRSARPPCTRGSRWPWRPSWPARAAPRTSPPAGAIDNLVAAFEAGLRKTLARMGISAVASYIGGSLVDTVDLAPDVIARCFPMAAAWPGRDDPGRPRRSTAPSARGGAGPATDAGRSRAAAARSRLRPVPGRRRGAPLLAVDRQGDPGPVRLAAAGDDATAQRHRRRADPVSRGPGPTVRRAVRATRRAARAPAARGPRRSTTSRTPGRWRDGSSSRR